MRQPASRQENSRSSSTLVRWGGLAAVLGGALFAVWGFIHREDAPLYFTVAANTLAFIVPSFFLLGLTGLYGQHKGQVSLLEGTGFTLGFIGSTWGAVRSIVDMSFWHAFWHAYAPGMIWIPKLLDWLPLLLIGLMLVGVAILRTRMSQGWGTLLLTMGLFGWVYCFTDFPGGIVETRLGHIVSGVLFSLSWVVLGYTLWVGRGNDLGKTGKCG